MEYIDIYISTQNSDGNPQYTSDKGKEDDGVVISAEASDVLTEQCNYQKGDSWHQN